MLYMKRPSMHMHRSYVRSEELCRRYINVDALRGYKEGYDLWGF